MLEATYGLFKTGAILVRGSPVLSHHLRRVRVGSDVRFLGTTEPWLQFSAGHFCIGTFGGFTFDNRHRDKLFEERS